MAGDFSEISTRSRAAKEFHISESHAYKILNWGKVVLAFKDEINVTIQLNSDKDITLPTITEREARRIKPHLPEALALPFGFGGRP